MEGHTKDRDRRDDYSCCHQNVQQGVNSALGPICLVVQNYVEGDENQIDNIIEDFKEIVF